MAFRVVQNEVFPSVPGNSPVRLELRDKMGVPLANGLYYVWVSVGGGRSSPAKLLVLR